MYTQWDIIQSQKEWSSSTRYDMEGPWKRYAKGNNQTQQDK